VWWSVELLLLRSRLPPGLFLDILAGCRLRLDCSDSRRYSLGTGVMVPVVLLERFAVVQRNLGVDGLLSSMLLAQVVRVVLMGCGNYTKLDTVCPFTEVRTTRC
jgi:hypothetical protein